MFRVDESISLLRYHPSGQKQKAHRGHLINVNYFIRVCYRIVLLTKAGLVISIRVCKMEIAMEFSIIKVNSYSVVCFLVHCPDSAGQVKAYISLKNPFTTKGLKDRILQRYLLLPLHEVLPG